MNPPFDISKSQKLKPSEQKRDISDNKELAIKGRFVTSIAFLLVLHSQGFIKLNKLPLIGMTFDETQHGTITTILLSVLLYALYKYWVYKRVAELNSSIDIYSAKVKNNLLAWYFTKLFKSAFNYARANNDLAEFKFLGKDYSLMSPCYSKHKKDEYYSFYNLVIWKYSNHLEKDIDESLHLFYPSTNKDEWFIDITTAFYFEHESNDGSLQSTMNNTFCYSFKTYKRVTWFCNTIAYFTLPDFIERTAPYVFAWAAILATIFLSEPLTLDIINKL
jgi:hypothetical protein